MQTSQPLPPPPPEKSKRGKQLIFLVTVIAVTFAILSLVIILPMMESDSMDLQDPANDVLVSQGQTAPGIVDITGALFQRNANQGNLTIRFRQETPTLPVDETVDYEVTLILENNSELQNLYILYITFDSQGTYATMENIIEETAEEVQINMNKNILNATLTMHELENCDTLEWTITSTYEKYMGNELMGNAFDFAPDQGTHITSFLKTEKT